MSPSGSPPKNKKPNKIKDFYTLSYSIIPQFTDIGALNLQQILSIKVIIGNYKYLVTKLVAVM